MGTQRKQASCREYLCTCVHVLLFCNPMDCSLPASSLHGIFQARILEWVAIPYPRDLPDPGTKPKSPALQDNSLLSEAPGKPREYLSNPKKILVEIWR